MNSAEIIFSIPLIKEKVSLLTNIATKHSVNLLLSVKALPNKEVLHLIGDGLNGFDVSNSNEYSLTPTDAFHFITHCPVDDLAFTANKNEQSLLVSCNSLYVWHEVKKRRLPYVLRLDSSQLYGDNLYQSQFGISLDDIKVIGTELKNDPKFKGFHLHHGSQANNLKSHSELIKNFANFLEKLDFRAPLILNLGGGFDGMSIQDIDQIFEIAKNELIHHRIFFEPGRYYTEGTGKCFAKIIDLKFRSGTVVATLNVSRECHLKWSRLGKVQHLPSSFSPYSVESSKLVLKGNSCYENDLIAELSFPQVQKFSIGDEIILSNISGYSFSWNHSFNGIDKINIRFEG